MGAMSRIQTTREDGVLTLEFDNPPAHAISRAFVADLWKALDAIEDDPPEALVLTATGERFFSAGLDVVELYPLEREEIEIFFGRFVESVFRIYRYPFPVVLAVNGHALAGGAICSMAADHRLIARGKHLFGWNELQVGLPLPPALFELVRGALSPRDCPRLLLEGKNISVDDALTAGIFEESFAPEELRARAIEKAKKLASMVPLAYARMKEIYHANVERAIEASGGIEDDRFLETWFEPRTREVMGRVVERLTTK